MGDARWWKILIIKLALASVACSASAQGLSPIALEELQPVFDRTIQLQRDVISAGRGIVAARTGLTNSLCFSALSVSLTLLSADLLRLQTLVFLAEQMHDPYDAQTVLSQIKDGSVALLARIETDRRSINQTPNSCPTNTFVAVKAQELLNLYTSATSALRTIVSRL